MRHEHALEIDRMLSDVLWAKERGLGPRDLVPMLEKILKRAPRGSDVRLFAQRELAEQLVERDTWRAARLAREVTLEVDDDRAWALFALCHSLLGNYRLAKKAYLRALALHPGCPWYSHNLGHLLDVGLGRPREALGHLRLAHRALQGEPEVAGSYALALARLGRRAEARRVLCEALGESEEQAELRLDGWIDSLERR
jgi:tetratricopeptide (TPR) repeat protein